MYFYCTHLSHFITLVCSRDFAVVVQKKYRTIEYTILCVCAMCMYAYVVCEILQINILVAFAKF